MNKTRCSVTVWDRSGTYNYQCTRTGSVERDGKRYCRQHDPVAVEERTKKRNAEWERERKQNDLLYDAMGRIKAAENALLNHAENCHPCCDRVSALKANILEARATLAVLEKEAKDGA